MKSIRELVWAAGAALVVTSNAVAGVVEFDLDACGLGCALDPAGADGLTIQFDEVRSLNWSVVSEGGGPAAANWRRTDGSLTSSATDGGGARQTVLAFAFLFPLNDQWTFNLFGDVGRVLLGGDGRAQIDDADIPLFLDLDAADFRVIEDDPVLSAVPLPASGLMLAGGLFGLRLLRRTRR